MRAPVLVVPAVACLVVGAVLGVWGWDQRDASRTQMIEEAEARFDDEVDMWPDLGPPPSPYQAACADLLAAADVRLPGQVPLPGDPSASDPAVPGVPPVPAEELAPVLASVLLPERVAGIVELDITEVHEAMAAMRAAVVDASTAGRVLYDDPAVQVAGLELRAAVQPLC